jgi:hypothetical protein
MVAAAIRTFLPNSFVTLYITSHSQIEKLAGHNRVPKRFKGHIISQFHSKNQIIYFLVASCSQIISYRTFAFQLVSIRTNSILSQFVSS